MRNTRSLIIISLLFIGMSGVSAQKFGHINNQELYLSMPESDSAQARIEALAQQYQDQLEEMNVERNKKYDEYLTKRDTYTDLIRQTKEADITEINQRIEAFQQNADMDLQNKQQLWLRPIIEKANKAIKDVATENGFIYIFDISRGNPVYWSDDSVDILPMVKTKLGI